MQYHSPYMYAFNVAFLVYTLYARTSLNLDKFESAIMIILTIGHLIMYIILFSRIFSTESIRNIMRWKMTVVDVSIIVTSLAMNWNVVKAYYILYTFGIACFAYTNIHDIIMWHERQEGYPQEDQINHII